MTLIVWSVSFGIVGLFSVVQTYFIHNFWGELQLILQKKWACKTIAESHGKTNSSGSHAYQWSSYSVHLTQSPNCMFWTHSRYLFLGRNNSTWRKPTLALERQTNSTQKGQRSNQWSSLWKVRPITTFPPCGLVKNLMCRLSNTVTNSLSLSKLCKKLV